MENTTTRVLFELSSCTNQTEEAAFSDSEFSTGIMRIDNLAGKAIQICPSPSHISGYFSSATNRIQVLRTKEERPKNEPEDVYEVVPWLSRSPKLEEKGNSEKRKDTKISE